ncbi:endolytic transglycosylase MltG [Robiginitalea sp. SC105]|uniref:endolytic transglycosylase MltG n=1 Tax=Robiginitalea sp. SC105 TaxID=2762332 RepID=UPI00163A42D6|nr:endolytic transglycosylase MltG [Robiginitalea sp. SC105]MBC2840789.1 endolytic transglycosylase MltG [Robiginitalea sp. SC105]
MYRRRILLIVLLGGLVVAGYFAFMVYRALFTPNTAFENEVAYLYIPTDASYQEVRAQLDPLLADPETFDAVARQKKYPGNIRPGKYPVRKGMNNNEIVNSLRSANTPVRVSFNNQETPASLAGRIADQIEADSAGLLAAFTDPSFLGAHGWTQDQALLPYIPNSYEFFWNTGAEEFRQRMLQEYERFWSAERLAKAREIGLEPEEVIALASIVHKETAKPEERPRVAGLYLNRLRQGMALQADPTVIYAIKKTSGNFDTIIKRVLYRDLELDSPYNTYKYGGVPPGPIFMPDISAIDAVLNPESHEYLYMVADTENFGYHQFAKTLAQHNRNKEQYIRWINSMNIRR